MATKRKLVKVAKPVENTTKLPNSTRIDETKTAVSVPERLLAAATPVETIEISSDPESDYDDLSDSANNQDANRETPLLDPESDKPAKQDAKVSGPDTQIKDAAQEGDESDAEPTFGDLLLNQETVDVAAALGGQQPQDTTLAALPQRQIAPTATSLGTVLAQALKTDDTDLLESCLHTSDTTVIRNTIQRLDSSLAGTLLTQLAARLHRRPGRAHNLMSFVQWTLIAHGGALATQPDIQKRLSELNRVLEERSRGLNSLLSLKGKLDMLEAQMTLRRGNRSRRQDNSDSDSESDDEGRVQGIVYVEGQEDTPLANGVSRRRDEDDDELPVVNGVASDSEEESDDEDQDELDVDEFAEESVDEDEVDHDDIEEDSAEEEDESEPEAAPPAKVQKKSKSWFSRS